MANGSGALTALYLLLGFIVGLICGYVVIVIRHRPKYLALAEYRVFIDEDTMPEQDLLMAAILRRPGVGSAEGLIMSDVRLSIGLVRRDANQGAFRPDLLSDLPDWSQEFREALGSAKAFVRLRYHSEQPLQNKTHLRFLVVAAATVAEMRSSAFIYDAVAERFHKPAAFPLTSKTDAFENHVRIAWNSVPSGGFAETVGLRKVGVGDLKTEEMEPDERLIVCAVLEEAASHIWENGAATRQFEVEAYADRFQITLLPEKDDRTPIRIMRIQTK